MHWAADYFGQSLSWLSDAEFRGRLPTHWNRYPDRLTSMSYLLRAERNLIRIRNGTIDDYVFRVAARLKADPALHPKVAEAREAAVDLIEEMLGHMCVDTSRWPQYHPDMRVPTPPRQVFHETAC